MKRKPWSSIAATARLRHSVWQDRRVIIRLRSATVSVVEWKKIIKYAFVFSRGALLIWRMYSEKARITLRCCYVGRAVYGRNTLSFMAYIYNVHKRLMKWKSNNKWINKILIKSIRTWWKASGLQLLYRLFWRCNVTVFLFPIQPPHAE